MLASLCVLAAGLALVVAAEDPATFLHERGVPMDYIKRMTASQQSELHSHIANKDGNASSGIENGIIIAECMHGLGNRIRFLGAALAFAAQTRRLLLLSWPADRHLNASFHSLFSTYVPALATPHVMCTCSRCSHRPTAG